jgi:PASTA domain
MPLVNKWSHHQTGSNTSNTVTVAPAQGDNLIIFVNCSVNPVSVTISDNLGTVTYYTAQSLATANSTAYVTVLYAENIPAGLTSIKASFGASISANNIFVADVSGLYNYGDGSSFDVASTLRGANSNSPLSNTATAHTSNPYCFGFVGNNGTTTTISSITGGYVEEDSLAGTATSSAWGDQSLSGTSVPAIGASFGSASGWSAGVIAFRTLGNLYQPDSANTSITGNGPATTVANSVCSAGQLLIESFSLSNVSSASAGYLPSITDNVNSGAYNVFWTRYNASGSELRGLAYLVANASGTPTVTLASSTVYSGGSMGYSRWAGFSATPTLDGSVQVSTGTSTTPSGTFLSTGVNELVAGYSFGGNSYSTPPTGWTAVASASNGDLITPYWLENTAPATASFTGGVLSSSETWVVALTGFASGPVPSSTAFPYFTGPGVSPDKRGLFFTRPLNSLVAVPQVNYVRGYSSAYGYGSLLPLSGLGANAYSGSYGYAVLTPQSISTPSRKFLGPGVSADWPQTFFARPLASSTTFVPSGVTAATGYSSAYGFVLAPTLGQMQALGFSSAYGFLRISATGALTGRGYASSYGWGNLQQYVASARAYSNAYGYAVGPAVLMMPNVITLPEAQAVNELQTLGLSVVVTFGYSTITAPGEVYQQSPPPGTVIASGSTVSIVVSLGQFVRAPNPNLGYKVSVRVFSLEEMVSREWGPDFRAPDHRIYVWSNDRTFDSTDLGTTGIYQKGTSTS